MILLYCLIRYGRFGYMRDNSLFCKWCKRSNNMPTATDIDYCEDFPYSKYVHYGLLEYIFTHTVFMWDSE